MYNSLIHVKKASNSISIKKFGEFELGNFLAVGQFFQRQSHSLK